MALILDYKYNKESPQNSIGNYLGPRSIAIVSSLSKQSSEGLLFHQTLRLFSLSGHQVNHVPNLAAALFKTSLEKETPSHGRLKSASLSLQERMKDHGGFN